MTAFQRRAMTLMEKFKMSPVYLLRKVTVEPVLFLYMFSLYLLFGVFQNLVYNSVCMLKYDEAVCGNLSAYEVTRVCHINSLLWC